MRLRVDDPVLSVGDAGVISSYSLARGLANTLVDPHFPGWLAPVPTQLPTLPATVHFAELSVSLWLLGGLATNAFSYEATASTDKAAIVAARAWAVAVAVGLVVVVCLRQTPHADQGLAVLGLGLTLVLWRACYASWMRRL